MACRLGYFEKIEGFRGLGALFTRVETTTLNYNPVDYLSTDDCMSSPVPYRVRILSRNFLSFSVQKASEDGALRRPFYIYIKSR